MKPAITPEIVIQSVSVLLSLFMISFFLAKGRKSKTLLFYIVCQVLVFIWSLGQVFALMTVDSDLKWTLDRIMYVSICFIGVSWLLLCLHYTNHPFIKNIQNVILLFVLPAALYSLVLTNSYHHLFYKKLEFGTIHYTFFWINVLVQYSYCIIGAAVLIKHLMKNAGNPRKQSIVLISAMLLPLFSNVLYNFKITSYDFDITPVSFSLSLLLLVFATFRYRFLSILPIAMRRIINNMKESFIVVDDTNRIIKYNEAFASNFIESLSLKHNSDIRHFVEGISEKIKDDPTSTEIANVLLSSSDAPYAGELKLTIPEKKSYSVNIQPIITDEKVYIGRIISFNDVTEYRKVLDELNLKNIELGEANLRLKEYASTVEELTLTKERNRIAHDVHDTLGHSMALLIALLEVSTITCRKDPAQTEEKLLEALKVSREGLKELRRSISGLVPEQLEASSLLNALKKLIEDYKPSGMAIDLSVEGIDGYRNTEYSDVIYRICQESLTNSLRHGKATQSSIILRFNDGLAKLFIFDNGCGCKNINKGFGLKGMEQRVKELGGSIVYGSDGESGFNIHVEIPLKG